MTSHPLYDDDELVRRVSEEHIAAGHTVFQLWQTAEDERLHSMRMLEALDVPEGASVLSLGCGVGGMERYWQEARPDLSFTLVNRSQAQLDLCLCKGTHWCLDIDTMDAQERFDVVVLAYVLGHVDVPRALVTAYSSCKPGGTVLVLDVFDSTPRFNDVMLYDAPRADVLQTYGFYHVDTFWHRGGGVDDPAALDVLPEAEPGMWIRCV